MSEWKPKPKIDAKTEDMNLTGEEGSVLSRVDGFMSLQKLAAATGLPEGRVKQILNKLVRSGAVEDASPAPAAPVARPARRPEPVHTEVDEISPEEMAEILGGTADGSDVGEDTQETEAAADAPADVLLPALAPDVEDRVEAQIDDDAPADAAGGDTGEGAATEGGEAEPEEANYRKLFNETLSKLEQPEREALARAAIDPQLLALCFDPTHPVIRGIFENSKAGMPHARMVARHHHTPQGLDVVMARAEFFRDAQVQRSLLQNTMLQEPQLKRLLQSKRLIEVYKIAISREIPERNRSKARNVLRSKWAASEGEERAGMVFTTEGRCLQMLTGLPFDSQMTMHMCSKTYTSSLLVQNLARFGATPPNVLSHLMKQAIVKRAPHLRQIIKQHPNCPSDVKRQA